MDGAIDDAGPSDSAVMDAQDSELPDGSRDAATETDSRVEPVDDGGIGDFEGELSIKGTVLCNGEGAAGVRLELWYVNRGSFPESGLLKETFTNRKGKYAFKNLAQGSYQIAAESLDYSIVPDRREVDLHTNTVGVAFLARRIQSHAKGRFTVVEHECVPHEGCGQTCAFDVFYGIEMGSVIEFNNGCLFGGSDCVTGTEYSEWISFGVPQDGGLVIVKGDFNEENGQWHLEIEVRISTPTSLSLCETLYLTLERVE